MKEIFDRIKGISHVISNLNLFEFRYLHVLRNYGEYVQIYIFLMKIKRNIVFY